MLDLVNKRSSWNLLSLKIHPLHPILRASHSHRQLRSTTKVIKGEGQNHHEWVSTKTIMEPKTQAETISFAPRGLPVQNQKLREKRSRVLTLESPLAKGAVARIHNTCSVRQSDIILY